MSNSYNGPERRSARSQREHQLSAILDEIDYGVLLMSDASSVAHVNHVARAELRQDHPIELRGRELRLRDERDAEPLHAAVNAAIQRGVRRMIRLGRDAASRLAVAVVPVLETEAGVPAAALLMFAKRHVCQDLSIVAFARCNGLTPTETAVLQGLCEGRSTSEIARRQGVAMATLRAQIASIRMKTGAPSLRALLGQVAVLPPLVSVLRQSQMAA